MKWLVGKFREKKQGVISTEVPVLCKFWFEDEVWNAVAADLPVAVYGHSFEEAQQHMRDAVICHLEAMEKLGEIKQPSSPCRKAPRIS